MRLPLLRARTRRYGQTPSPYEAAVRAGIAEAHSEVAEQDEHQPEDLVGSMDMLRYNPPEYNPSTSYTLDLVKWAAEILELGRLCEDKDYWTLIKAQVGHRAEGQGEDQ